MNNTGTPDGQGRHRRAALKEQSVMSLRKQHALVPWLSAGIYVRMAVPEASFGYFVDREPPLTKQVRKTLRDAIFPYL